MSNKDHPEYGVVTIPFPLQRDEYDHCIGLVEALEIGSPTLQDCQVDEIIFGAWPTLKRLEKTQVNLDELDYLAKRLDSFDVGEAAQFQAMAEKLDLHNVKDLINLTFCCQQATVITDFSDLEAVGRDHFMNLNGGHARTEELDALDGYETALLLIDSGAGVITPYGVVYDNGMQLEQLYDGKHLPAYRYEPDVLMVALTSRTEPDDTKNVTWIYLPAVKEQIDHAILRSGIKDPDNMRFRIEDGFISHEMAVALAVKREGIDGLNSIYELNDMALAINKLSQQEQVKLGAAVAMANPESAFQIRHLAENLDLFEFAPGAHTPEEYGKYMIKESGHFEYDPNLEDIYDFEKYGLQRMEREYGIFTDRGYISYQGVMSLDELMMEDPAERYQQEMGGMG